MSDPTGLQGGNHEGSQLGRAGGHPEGRLSQQHRCLEEGAQHQGWGRPAPAAPSWETRGCRSKAESPRAPATHLINTGTVAEGSGVAQVIDQAGDVAGGVRRLRELCVSADLVQLEQEGKGHVARRRHTEMGLAPGAPRWCCSFPATRGGPTSAAPAPRLTIRYFSWPLTCTVLIA